MSQFIRCYLCQAIFALDLETLHPYLDGLILGQRAPRYWTRCPTCGQKNVIELASASEILVGKPPAR